MNTISKLLKTSLIFVLAFLYTGTALSVEFVTYYHNDALGSPIATTDENGNKRWEEVYEPYGTRLLKEAKSGDNRVFYAGKLHDDELGLSYMNARYYDPRVGRFMGIDPVGFVEGNSHSFNRYAYANNNPYKFVDPDGESPVHAIKFALDLSVNLALNKATTGSFGLGRAFVESVVGLANPAKTFQNLSKLRSLRNLKKFKVSPNRAPGLRSTQARLDFVGEPNSIIRGSDVARGSGGKRAFITDENGRIIREITQQRVKVRTANPLPDGRIREVFDKLPGSPSAEDLKVLDRL